MRFDLDTGVISELNDGTEGALDGAVAPDPVAAVQGYTGLLGRDQQAINVWFVETGEESLAYPFANSGEWIGQNDWSDTAIAKVWTALRDIEAVANVRFVLASSAADAELDFVQNNLGLNFGTTGSITFEENGEVWNEATVRINHTRNARWSAGSNPGGQGYETLVHEIGHALGLDHTHDSIFGSGVIDGIADSGPFSAGTFGINDPINSIMAQRDGWAEMETSEVDRGNRINMGAWDVQALINIYGENTTTNAEDDTYILPYSDSPRIGYITIVDTGGTDTISGEGQAGSVNIDLRSATLDYNTETSGGPVSYFHDEDGNLVPGGFTIAATATIENAVGSSGNDYIRGNSSANLLEGLDGHDELVGATGADTLIGGLGRDTLSGGSSRDTFVFLGNDAHADIITDFADGETIVFEQFIAREYVRVNEANGQTTIEVDLNRDGGFETSLILLGSYADDLSLFHEDNDARTVIAFGDDPIGNGTTQFTEIFGTSRSDRITASDAAEIVDALDGNDRIDGRGGSDQLFGGAGIDTLRGHNGDDSLYGGSHDDRLYGENGDDAMFGDGGTDRLEGGDGNDTLDGGDGNDFMYGRNGNDVIIDNSGNNNIEGNNGDDSLIGGDLKDTIRGGNDNDTLEGNGGDDQLIGGSGADLILAGHGDDYVKGGNEEDLIYLASGSDRAEGGQGADTIFAGSGDDSLIGNEGDDILRAETGNDRVVGGTGNDFIVLGSGDDYARGENGNDTIYGGTGIDTLEGGALSDRFVYRRGDDADQIRDFDRNGNDVIELSGLGWRYNSYNEVMDAASVVDGRSVMLDFGNGDTLTLIGVTIESLTTDDFLFS